MSNEIKQLSSKIQDLSTQVRSHHQAIKDLHFVATSLLVMSQELSTLLDQVVTSIKHSDEIQVHGAVLCE